MCFCLVTDPPRTVPGAPDRPLGASPLLLAPSATLHEPCPVLGAPWARAGKARCYNTGAISQRMDE